MKVHRKHKSFKERLKAARELGKEEGIIEATKNFGKSIRKLGDQTQIALITLEGAHEKSIKLMQTKEEEFSRLCDDKSREIQRLRDLYEKVSHHEAEGTHHARKLNTMYTDEKREKFNNLNYSRGEMEYHYNMVKKELEKNRII